MLYTYRPHSGLASLQVAGIAVGGVMVSALLGGLVWSLTRTRERANRLADEMTLSHKTSKEFAQCTVNALRTHVAILDEHGEIVALNPRVGGADADVLGREGRRARFELPGCVRARGGVVGANRVRTSRGRSAWCSRAWSTATSRSTRRT